MTQFKIEPIKRGSMITHKISGFTDKQLSELNSMDYRDMKQVIMETLTSRRLIPYGTVILNAWVSGKDVFIETGVCK